jgi:2-dehydro-3-deoxygluconokinase
MIVTFGEIMMRLAPPGYQRLVQANVLEMTFGGGEANVAVSLANFGVPVRFVTKLPDNDLGQACRGEIARWGVDVSKIIMCGERLGIYFCEKGASQRPSKVIYDRAYSSIAGATEADFDWDIIFEGAEWFHFTGITPALGDNVAAVTQSACRKAKEKGITVSCDLNYRKKLWSREKAGKVMAELMPYVDFLIANEEDAADVFGISAKGSAVTEGEINYKGYRAVAEQLTRNFGIKKVAITLRESLSASDNVWSALLYSGGETFISKRYAVHIVDRVGGGDAFGAGLIYGFMQGLDNSTTLEFATAAGCLKHSIEGDFNMVSVDEVKALANGSGSGRIQR